ncbi:FAD-dependent oxidoreductase [Breoghania sp. JC706]|uniref:NAD(P)/FAD-dependent oxidoreductase n=1 Tax=Breoghania sp. JC706 TaxID=3117732 RepID=UPI00300A5C20
MERIVVIGSGQGGVQAAISLRQEGYTGKLTVIGAESGLPYQRPPLSKAFLKSGDADALRLRPAAFYEKNNIDLVDGTRVEWIDRANRVVHAGASAFGYDHLILATGTRNLRPPIPGAELALDLRTLEDAVRLRAALAAPRRCAVIGGGFIGLEFAAVARSLGHAVTVAEAAPRLMARVVSPEMSARFLALHEAMGTSVRLADPAVAISEDGIMLAGGDRIEADLILMAAGVVPNTELAQGAGLAVENGVVVDCRLVTEDPAISALGDCCAFPDPVTDRLVRLESVQAATDHARLIARRLVRGERASYAAVPWFWSDQSDHKLQIAGLSSAADGAIVRGDGATFRFCGERISAVETVNDAKTHMQARKRLAISPIFVRDLEAAGLDLGAL